MSRTSAPPSPASPRATGHSPRSWSWSDSACVAPWPGSIGWSSAGSAAATTLAAPQRSATPAPHPAGLPRRAPQGDAWLIRLHQPLAQLAPRIALLLHDPEIAALCEAAPQAARLLRPLARMFGLAPPSLIARRPGPPGRPNPACQNPNRCPSPSIPLRSGPSSPSACTCPSPASDEPGPTPEPPNRARNRSVNVSPWPNPETAAPTW